MEKERYIVTSVGGINIKKIILIAAIMVICFVSVINSNTVTATTENIHNPKADTFIIDGDGTNFATETGLSVYLTGGRTAWLLYSLENIPAGSIIDNAILYAYQRTGDSSGLVIKTKTSENITWVETILSGTNEPSVENIANSWNNVVNTWAPFDVTSYVSLNMSLNKGFVTIVLYQLAGTGNVAFGSKEDVANQRNYMVVVYHAPSPSLVVGKSVIITPDNNSTKLYNDNVLFSWSKAANAENYRIEISNDINFASTVENTTLTDNIKYIILNYVVDNYYLRVWAENKNMVNGENVSNTFRFSITKIVNKPILSYPENNSVFVQNDTVLFGWSLVTNAENYRLEISKYENFMTTVENTITVDNYLNIYLNFTPDNYWWRVWAENKNLLNGENNSLSWKVIITQLVIENNGSIMVTSGTFSIEETVTIYAQVIRNNLPVNDNVINIKIYNQAGNLVINDNMIYITSSNGLYRFSTEFSTEGNYICDISIATIGVYGSNNLRILADSSAIYTDLIKMIFIIFVMIIGISLLVIRTQPLMPLFIGFAIGVIASFVYLPLFPYMNLVMLLIGIGDILTSMQGLRSGKKRR